MKIDVSSFKKVKSDEKTTTLRGKDGHEIVLAHNALSPKYRKKLSQLELHQDNSRSYADGGDVEEPSWQERLNNWVGSINNAAGGVSSATTPAINQANQKMIEETSPKPASIEQPEEPPPLTTQQGLEAVNADQPPQQEAAPQQDMMGYGQYAKDIRGGVGNISAAAKDYAKAQGQLGEAQAKIYQDQQAEMQKVQEDGQKRFNYYLNQADAVAKDAINDKINPNHYMESMSSGKKVATAIGLILGGMGAGLTGGENPAAKYLNDQIQRDVEAQKANLGNKQTIFSHLLQQGESVQNATKIAQAYTANIYANKILAEASKMQSPFAQAQAKQEAAKIQLQYAPILQQASMHGAMMNSMKNVQDPAKRIRIGVISGVIPKEEEENLYKELEVSKGMVRARDNILGAFEQASKLNTITNRALNPIQAASQLRALIDPLVAGLSKETAGRFTEQDAKYLATLFPSVTDSEKTLQIKRNAINKLISQKMNFPRLEAYDINPYGEQKYGTGGEKKIQLGPVAR